MRTTTDPLDSEEKFNPFGPKVEPTKKDEYAEWQPSPDAPGVEYNWKTGKHRTNMHTPNAWTEDLAMQMKDEKEFEARERKGQDLMASWYLALYKDRPVIGMPTNEHVS